MATSIFNDIKDITLVASYNSTSNKTLLNILIDTYPRIEGQAVAHEEVTLMVRGMPSEVRTKIKEAFKHFLELE